MSTAKYPRVSGYDLVQQIGGGGFSTVYRAVNIPEQKIAACKVITITASTTDKDRKTFEKEMRVHSALKHTNVLEFLNAVVVEMKHQATYHPGIYILLELAAGGDLFDKIEPDRGVGHDVAHLYFNQLVSGMEYIHQQGVCHRDLKPENLLLDAAGTLKISDFGLSAVYKLTETGKTRTLSERCGSLPYIAPELAIDAPYRAEPIDVWGMGVILFTLLAGNTPWDEPTRHSPEFVRYVNGQIFGEAPWNIFPDNTLSLLTGMLDTDPSKRLTISDIMGHPWCIRASQLVNSGPVVLANMLTAGLRENGDLELASPNFTQAADSDGDQMMFSAGHQSQFTQSLMLFSQTQSGNRYTPHLTRFYASADSARLIALVQESLTNLGIKSKSAPRTSDGLYRLRIGGFDRRKEAFKGWVDIESFVHRGSEGSFCVMQRDEGNPLSWRMLWKVLIQSSEVGPYVLRK